jgi:hypothetical protein
LNVNPCVSCSILPNPSTTAILLSFDIVLNLKLSIPSSNVVSKHIELVELDEDLDEDEDERDELLEELELELLEDSEEELELEELETEELELEEDSEELELEELELPSKVPIIFFVL